MNTDTIQTLVRSVLKIGGGIMISKGYADGSTWEVIASGAVAAVGVIWGIWHRTPKV